MIPRLSAKDTMTAPIALVTGASRGLGREVARRLVQVGFTVVAGTRKPSPLEGAQVVPLDVSDEIAIRGVADAVKLRFGHLDVLVNNAGILLDEAGGILDLEGSLLQRTFQTNVIGPLRLSQALAPLMVRGGRIINVSSGGGQLSNVSGWAPGYCISKTALNAVTVHLAAELKPRGIAVNSVCPGWVRTDMGGMQAPRSLAEGAASILWLILEAAPELTGGFWRDGQRIDW